MRNTYINKTELLEFLEINGVLEIIVDDTVIYNFEKNLKDDDVNERINC